METIKNLLSAESVLSSTTLVTLYINASKNALWLSRDHIVKELKTASNIKNKQVGKHVTNALKMIQYKLNTLKTIPMNGIVLCSGDFKTKSESYV